MGMTVAGNGNWSHRTFTQPAKAVVHTMMGQPAWGNWMVYNAHTRLPACLHLDECAHSFVRSLARRQWGYSFIPYVELCDSPGAGR